MVAAPSNGECVAMPRTTRRPTLILLAGLFLAGLGATSSPASVSATDISVPAAEIEMARIINRDRARHGLVPIRLDARLMTIAGNRSNDMATKGYFSHTQPDGRNVFDLLASSSIRWYSAGEIIAWNNWPGMVDSANAANSGWMNSDGHRHIILSRSYNYMGIGLAIAGNGRKYWTGVFLRGPDRTGGWVRYTAPRVDAAAAGTRRVSFGWTGGDVRLPVLTAGFHSYNVQRRVDGGAWVNVRAATTARTYAVLVARGHTVELRVRAKDRVGNYGSWRTVTANT
jgi:uncharacterized protein YkwD